MTKVFLVDDHGMLRAGLRALISAEPSLELIGEADDGRTAVKMIADADPDVVIMDIRMPELNGVEATRQIVADNPNVKVIGLSANDDRQSVVEMMRAGAMGYVVKESAFEELSTAVTTVMKNKVYLSPAVTNLVVNDWVGGEDGPASVFGVLSAREREVLQLIAEGKATKEVALLLNVSLKTAESHRRNLMEKLHVDSIAELTKYAIREGITSL